MRGDSCTSYETGKEGWRGWRSGEEKRGRKTGRYIFTSSPSMWPTSFSGSSFTFHKTPQELSLIYLVTLYYLCCCSNKFIPYRNTLQKMGWKNFCWADLNHDSPRETKFPLLFLTTWHMIHIRWSSNLVFAKLSDIAELLILNLIKASSKKNFLPRFINSITSPSKIWFEE